MGDVHPPRLRERTLQVYAARGRQGRAACRMRAAELEGTALGRCGAAQGVSGVRIGISMLVEPSLRAKRSNPDFLRGRTLDCFVASLLAMTERGRKKP